MKIAFAYFALLLLLPFALYVFRRQPTSQAASIVVLVGSILLPPMLAIDLPAIPPMDREYITYLSVLIAAYVFRRSAVIRARPGRNLELVLILLFFANIATARMNPMPMFIPASDRDCIFVCIFDFLLQVGERSPRNLGTVSYLVGVDCPCFHEVTSECVQLVAALAAIPVQRLARVVLFVPDLAEQCYLCQRIREVLQHT